MQEGTENGSLEIFDFISNVNEWQIDGTYLKS